MAMTFTIETEQEEDGRWIAEVMEIPGAMVYGATPEEAVSRCRRWRCVCWRSGWSMVRARN